MCRCNECKHRFGGREMKREELKYFYATDGEVGTMPLLHNCFVYPKEDVDHLLDEKDAEIESLKASHYAEMVDAGMRERRLKRALWLARANRAIEKIAWFKLWNASISTMNPEDGTRQEYDKWKKNLGKFLKKSEAYR